MLQQWVALSRATQGRKKICVSPALPFARRAKQQSQSRSINTHSLPFLKLLFFFPPTFSYLHVCYFPQAVERVPFESLQLHIHIYGSKEKNTEISSSIWRTYCLLNGKIIRKDLLCTTCLACKKESSVPAVQAMKSKRCFHKTLGSEKRSQKTSNSFPNSSICQSRRAIWQECASTYTLPKNQSPCAHVHP